jgi:iron complex outermembrane receptor protein
MRGAKIYSEYVLNKELYYDTANLLEAEDKKELNVGLSWLLGHFLLTLEANNLQDNQYEDFNGYPLPGRSFFGAITYKY